MPNLTDAEAARREGMARRKPALISGPLGIGEGGIRTLVTLLGYGALAKRCFRPLSHLTKMAARIWRTIGRCELVNTKKKCDAHRAPLQSIQSDDQRRRSPR